jgi:Xaa-Pro aminopeptidase
MARLFDYQRATRLMEKHGLDVMIVHSKHHVSYLADYWWKPRMGWPSLIIRPTEGFNIAATLVGIPADETGGPFVVGWSEEANYIQARDPWIKDRRFWGPPMPVTGRPSQVDLHSHPVDAAADALQQKGLAKGRIGLEMQLVPYEFYRRFETLLPQASLLDAGPVLRELKMIKTWEEIRRKRAAAQATENAIHTTYAAMRAGITDWELERIMMKTLIDEGALHYNDNVAIGPKGAGMVGATGEKLQHGQVVRLELGGQYERYPCDMSRVRVFGKPSETAQHVHDVIRETSQLLREAVKPGIRCSELYHMGKDYMARGGLTLLNVYIGHSIGCEQVHQFPFLSANDHTVLQPGMVVVTEPTVRYEGVGSVNIEDEVLVTEAGNEPITTLSREILAGH